MIVVNKPPLFKLGRIVATPGVLEALQRTGELPGAYLTRHSVGDWGIVSDEDKAANDESLKDGSRLLSAYRLKDETKIWIITEAEDDNGQRAATTILLPDEY